MRKRRRRFGLAVISLDDRRGGMRGRNDARQDRRLRRLCFCRRRRRRTEERTVPRRPLPALDMRAQPTIIALKRGLAPEPLHTDIALGAAAAGEQAAREEKVERAPRC